MRQRLPYYGSAWLVLAAAYLQLLSHGRTSLAAAVLIATLLGIFAVAGFEAWLHERDCDEEFPVHRGWFDAEEVRAVLGPQADAAEQTVEIPVQSVWTDPDDMPAEPEPEPAPIEAALRADLVQEQASLDEIRDRYFAAQQDAQRYLDSVIADMTARFEQVRWELGVYR